MPVYVRDIVRVLYFSDTGVYHKVNFDMEERNHGFCDYTRCAR